MNARDILETTRSAARRRCSVTASIIAALLLAATPALAEPYVFQIIAETGDVVPSSNTPGETATLGNFQLFGPFPAINERGDVAFHGFLDTSLGNVTIDDDEGLWSGDPSQTYFLAREGDPIEPTSNNIFDATGANNVFDGTLIINDLGKIAFGASTDGPAGGSFNDPGGTFAGTPGLIHVAAINGQPVPNDMPSSTFALGHG